MASSDTDTKMNESNTTGYQVTVRRPYYDDNEGSLITACNDRSKTDSLIAGYLRQKAHVAVYCNGSSMINMIEPLMLMIFKCLNNSTTYTSNPINLSNAEQGKVYVVFEEKYVLIEDWVWNSYPGPFKGKEYKNVGRCWVQIGYEPIYVIKGIDKVTSKIIIKLWFEFNDASHFNDCLGHDNDIDIAGYKFLKVIDNTGYIKYDKKLPIEHKYIKLECADCWKKEDENKYFKTGYIRESPNGDPARFDLEGGDVITFQCLDSMELWFDWIGVVINHVIDCE